DARGGVVMGDQLRAANHQVALGEHHASTEDGAPLPMVDGEPRTLQVEGRGASRRRLRTELDTAVEDQPLLVGEVAVGAAIERVVRPPHLDATVAPKDLLPRLPRG